MVENLKKYLRSDGMSTKSITAVVVFGAIIMVFVFFGMPSRHASQLGGYAARVNDRYITFAELKEEVSQREQYFRQFGGQFGGEFERSRIQEEAVSALVERELLNQTAKLSGIEVSDAEVREFITTEIPGFQRDGKFQRDLYRQGLDYSGQSAQEFEDKVRQHLRSQRSRRIFETVGTPTPFENDKDAAIKALKLNVAFVKVSPDKVTSGFTVSDAELKQKMSEEGFKTRVKTDLESNRAMFEKPEQVKASHILIKIDDKTPEAEALKKIKTIKARLDKEDFGKVASEVSEDPGSKAKKGDLGFFTRGTMVPEFDTIAFSAPIGKVSEPVKSSFGYHLIKVTDKKAATKTPEDQASQQIARKLLANDQFEADAKGLEESLKQGQTEQIEAFIKKWKLSWEDSGPFDLNQEFIPKLSSSVASQAAFEVSQEKPFLPRVVRDGDSKFIIKWKAAVAAEAKPSSEGLDDLMGQFSGRGAGFHSFEMIKKWIDSERKSAQIEINPSVISKNRQAE